MKNKIVTLLCILTILITTCIAAANSDGGQIFSSTGCEIANLVNGGEITNEDNPLYEDIKLVPLVYINEDGQTVDATAKEVQVQNKGNNSVFVRTVFAFEAGNLNWSDIHTGFNSAGWTYEGLSNETKIDIAGKDYYMVVATYNNELGQNGVTACSLTSIGFYKNAAVTSDKIASLGDEFEMRIVSQATLDKDGFANNPITKNNHPWINEN